MENKIDLPYEELRNYGLVDEKNNFTDKMSKIDIEHFIKGSTLVLDNMDGRISFNLKDNKLEINKYEKDVFFHNDLTSNELLNITKTSAPLYKPLADHGKIKDIGFVNLNPESSTELTKFIEIENDRGVTKFYGNDLDEKIKGFNIGDQIQVNNTGIKKSVIEGIESGEKKEYNIYTNEFKIEPLTEENKELKTKIYEYSKSHNSILSLDTSKLEFDLINGQTLTPQQIQLLREGKEVDLEDDVKIGLSAKSDNKFGLTSNNKNLLVVSLFLDGGISFIAIMAVKKLNSMIAKNNQDKENEKIRTSLIDAKKLVEAKIKQGSGGKKDKEILDQINKEISKVDDKTSNSLKNKKESGWGFGSDKKEFGKGSIANLPIKEGSSYSGILVDKGLADYLDDPNNSKSYFVTIVDKDNNAKKLWGANLEGKTKDIPLFQNVDITFKGKEEVKIPIKDKEGEVIGYKDQTAMRNSFQVEQNDKRMLTEKDIQSFKSNNEKMLEIKGFLQSKASLYPNNKEIRNNINIIDKYLDSTFINKGEENKNLQTVDHDTFEDANAKKEVNKKKEELGGNENDNLSSLKEKDNGEQMESKKSQTLYEEVVETTKSYNRSR